MTADLASKGALGFYRDSVVQGIRVAKVLFWAWPFELAALYLLARSAQDRETTFVTVLVSLEMTFIAAWCFFMRLPRLRRERAELE